MPNIDYSLTPEQKKAWESLKRAFKKCSDAGIYMWDYSGTVCAVNGNSTLCVNTDEKNSDMDLDQSMMSGVKPKCWNNSCSDDQLFVTLDL